MSRALAKENSAARPFDSVRETTARRSLLSGPHWAPPEHGMCMMLHELVAGRKTSELKNSLASTIT